MNVHVAKQQIIKDTVMVSENIFVEYKLLLLCQHKIFVRNQPLVNANGIYQTTNTTIDKIECQETYRLNADGIFLKSRDRDGVVTEVLGMYNLINNSNEPTNNKDNLT